MKKVSTPRIITDENSTVEHIYNPAAPNYTVRKSKIRTTGVCSLNKQDRTII
jgi:hypothetical protein